MRDQRLDKRLEAKGVVLWCTDQSSGLSDDHRSFVLHAVNAVKLETKGDSQQERRIRALCDSRISEKGEAMCSVVHESGLRELVSQLVIGALLTHDVRGAKQR